MRELALRLGMAITLVLGCAGIAGAGNTLTINGTVEGIQTFYFAGEEAPAGCVLTVDDGADTMPVRFYAKNNPTVCTGIALGGSVHVEAFVGTSYCEDDYCVDDVVTINGTRIVAAASRARDEE